MNVRFFVIPIGFAVAAACGQFDDATSAGAVVGGGGAAGRAGAAQNFTSAKGGDPKGGQAAGTAGESQRSTEIMSGNVNGSDGGAPSTVAACERAVSGEQKEINVTVNGKERRFLAVPPTNPSGGPLPILVGYHGGNLGGDNAASWGFSSDESGKSGQGKRVLGLYPYGLAQEWSENNVGWDQRQPETEDVAFTDAILAWAKENYCIDSKKIFAAGHSWGGYMATHIGCVRPDVFRGVVTLGGGGPSNLEWCKKPVAAMVVLGADDNLASPSDSQDSLSKFRQLSGCTKETTNHKTDDFSCDAYASCALNGQVSWCSYRGGHYPWPRSMVDPIWAWFDSL